MAKFKTKMHFLGKKFVDNRGVMNDKGKEKTSYFMVRMEDQEDNLYEWFVPAKKENQVLIDTLNSAKKFQEYQVMIEVRAYQGKPMVDLVGMAE